MTKAERILESSDTVIVVDWPTVDVPDTLAGAGYSVFVKGGPGPNDYSAYELRDNQVVVRRLGGRPDGADLVYAHRPIEELSVIVSLALEVGARAVWIQSGLSSDGKRHPRGCWMPKGRSDEARQVVESAGLAYIEHPYIADTVRESGIRK
jgi:predicted CoA-binding protein